MDIANSVRGQSYILGVLKAQQADPFCRGCNAYSKVLAALKETIDARHASELAELPAELAGLAAAVKSDIDTLVPPANTIGQKKAGNCKLPEGVCFIKSSYALLQRT